MDAIRPLYRWMRANLLHSFIPKGRAVITADRINSVEVVSYFKLASGVAEGARLCVADLARCGMQVIACVDVAKSVRKKAEISWTPPQPAVYGTARPPASLRILHLNPPMLPPAIFSQGITWYRNSLNVGYWAWELDVLPKEWKNALRYMDAILAPSQFTAEVIRKYTTKPVVVVPHPVRTASAEPDVRQQLLISENKFLVTTTFSFGSGIGRKNPAAAIRAFRRAFGDDEMVVLIVKCSHGWEHRAEYFDLLKICEGATNIRFVDEVWSNERLSGLLKASNAYISLHRSEGFGLTIAEAVLLQVPVVVTAWSGNLDFCCPESTDLVPVQLVPVRDSSPSYAALHNVHWAEADENFAASALRAIRANPERSRRRASRAAEFAQAHLANNSYLHAFDVLQSRQSA